MTAALVFGKFKAVNTISATTKFQITDRRRDGIRSSKMTTKYSAPNKKLAYNEATRQWQ
jgi:hypothetical protein